MQNALKHGADLEWRCKEWNGATVLVKAVRTGNHDLVVHLLAAKANPGVIDDSGRTLLHWNAVESNIRILEVLLKTSHGLLSNKSDSNGEWPIHLAALFGHLPVVRRLVCANADFEQETDKGATALQLAQTTSCWHIVEYLDASSDLQKDLQTKEPRLSTLDRPCNLARAADIRVATANAKSTANAEARAKSKSKSKSTENNRPKTKVKVKTKAKPKHTAP